MERRRSSRNVAFIAIFRHDRSCSGVLVGSGPAAARYFSVKLASAMLLRRGSMSNVKQEVEQLLNKLPDDCSVEDIQYHLYALAKVRRGLEDAHLNGTLSQQEVEIRLSQWLTE